MKPDERKALYDILNNIGPGDTEFVFVRHLNINYGLLTRGIRQTKRTQFLIELLEREQLHSEFISAVLRHLPDRADLKAKYWKFRSKDSTVDHDERPGDHDTTANLTLSRPIRVTRYRKQEIFDAEVIGNVAFSPAGDLMAFSLDDNLMLLPLTDPFPLPMPRPGGKKAPVRRAGGRRPVNVAGAAYPLPHNSPLRVTDISFSPDGEHLAASHTNGRIRIWLVAQRELVKEIEAHRDMVSAISFSPDGRYFASAGLDEIVNVWIFRDALDMKCAPWREFTKKSLIKKRARHAHDIERYYSLTFSQRGEHVATGDQQGVVVVRDLKTGLEIYRRKLHNHTVNCMAFSPSPSSPGLLATCSDDTRILLTDFMKESKPVTLGVLTEKHTKSVSSLSFSYNGAILVSSGHDGSVRLWDVASLRLLRTEETGEQQRVERVAFFPNKYDFATDCYSSDISLWNISNDGAITNTTIETEVPAGQSRPNNGAQAMMPGVQFEEVWKAFSTAYTKKSLEQMLRTRLTIDLDDIVADGPMKDMAFDLLGTSEREGWTTDLIREGYQFNPRNQELLKVYQKYGLAPAVSAQEAGAAVPGVRAISDGLEKTIKDRLPAFDFAVFRERMAVVEGQVCRVELGGNAAGTGFLVGPDAVLTNYHVLRSVLEGTNAAAQVTCRFDYKVLADGSRVEGVVVGLHPSDWRLDASPPSPAELTRNPDAPPPKPDELDYALVKLARKLGEEPGAPKGGSEAPRRGWLTIPPAAPAFVPQMPLLIAQYPDGKPLKLAVDTDAVIGVSAGGARVRYATNTDPGSSGSPVFDLDWNLVALHHLGDPAYDHPPAYNQGVPIDRIRARVAANGKAAALGN